MNSCVYQKAEKAEKEKARKLKKRIDTIKAEAAADNVKSSSSSSETDNSTGADADSEESVTSEEEGNKKRSDAGVAAKEMWVTVKSQCMGTQTAPEEPAS